uniref:Uncharacterized protein n=1 Tax=Grammatophora oceanica TaxID=210454 RepID=A0A7S1V4Z1_9STRA|mmetsp:Transcript_36586/g.54550  ORF Transcript_36586/g.54550 Transcript_36586/m.54550 type:complete len:270 (+) Transcript_36586:21-830(+)
MGRSFRSLPLPCTMVNSCGNKTPHRVPFNNTPHVMTCFHGRHRRHKQTTHFGSVGFVSILVLCLASLIFSNVSVAFSAAPRQRNLASRDKCTQGRLFLAKHGSPGKGSRSRGVKCWMKPKLALNDDEIAAIVDTSTDGENASLNRTIGFHNFWSKTEANFTICEKPERPHDFKSKGSRGSSYWHCGDYVIRCSNHWSGQHGIGAIQDCYWTLDSRHAKREFVTGRCYYKDFSTRIPSKIWGRTRRRKLKWRDRQRLARQQTSQQFRGKQ